MDKSIYLAHHGVKGQKWGVRRYQNADGTLTDAGKRRYKVASDGSLQKLSRAEKRAVRQEQTAQARKQSLDDYLSGKEQKFLARTSARQQIDQTRSAANREFRRSKQGKEMSDEWSRQYDLVDSLTKLRQQVKEADSTSVTTKAYLDLKIAEEKRALDKTAHRIAEAEGRHVCDRLIKEYGNTGFERFMKDSWLVGRRRDGESYVDLYIRNRYYAYKWDQD